MNEGTTVFFDLETGGVEPHHPIIQVAAVALRGWQEVDEFEAKIRFDPAKCDPEALRVNGYTADAWKGARAEGAVMAELARFFAKHADWKLVSGKTGRPYKVARLAGHSVVAFDIPRLREAMERAGLRYFNAAWWYPLDTYQLALWDNVLSGREAPANFRLETLLAHVGGKREGAAHEALSDVRAAIEVARTLAPAYQR